jgi:putative salt-induced outer membrane protein YdiY
MRLLILLMMCILSAEAVITIAPVDIGKQAGLSGSAKGSYVTKRGNTDSDEFSAGARVQYDNNTTYVIWGDLAFSYAKASGQTNTNKTYAHIRYIHTLYKKDVNWEAFVQSQTDKFTKIQKRLLAGVGLRYHAVMKNYGNIYFGFGGFAEHIDYTTNSDPSEDNVRLNIYIAYKNQLSKSVRFSYLGYYQPRVDLLSDYILSNSAELKVKIYKQLSINFELTYNQDTKPAIGVEKYDFSQKTSFVYDF